MLYPELESDDDERDAEKAELTEVADEIAEDSGEAPPAEDDNEDELLVSEWPDPVESGG